MFGGRYQSADLSDLNYAVIAEALGARASGSNTRTSLPTPTARLSTTATAPTLIDVVVTRRRGQDATRFDNRTAPIKEGRRSPEKRHERHS